MTRGRGHCHLELYQVADIAVIVATIERACIRAVAIEGGARTIPKQIRPAGHQRFVVRTPRHAEVFRLHRDTRPEPISPRPCTTAGSHLRIRRGFHVGPKFLLYE